MQRYLTRYAEPRAQGLFLQATAALQEKQYERCVVVPMYDEPTSAVERIFQGVAGTDTLAIVVVNAPEDAPRRAYTASLELVSSIARSAPIDVFTVDCVSTPLPAATAVGEARKIGSDIALYLHTAGLVKSPWLYQTDADAQLPADYFDTHLPRKGAVVFGHTHHSPDPSVQRAADLYDLHMAYYVAGLSWAGSPFAYPTLGSTIAVHSDSYASVRGYPKRNAAEDFYLLNKVAKVHGVTHIPHLVIQLLARPSHRVPFGTGPALEKIVEDLHTDPSAQFYKSYHWSSFQLLHRALNLLANFADAPEKFEADQVWASQANNPAQQLLLKLGFERASRHLFRQYKQAQQRHRSLREWFDAGKTLRFVHAARHYHPDQPLLRTVGQLPPNITGQLPQHFASRPLERSPNRSKSDG